MEVVIRTVLGTLALVLLLRLLKDENIVEIFSYRNYEYILNTAINTIHSVIFVFDNKHIEQLTVKHLILKMSLLFFRVE